MFETILLMIGLAVLGATFCEGLATVAIWLGGHHDRKAKKIQEKLK